MPTHERRRVILLLRWALTISLSYLMLFSAGTSSVVAALCATVLLASNLVIMRLPERVFHHPAFDPILVLVDMTLTTGGLWVCKASGPDFYFLFFFVIFMAALGERPELTAFGAALAAIGYLVLLHRGPVLSAAILLRVPFLFITGLTYGYLSSTAREAQARTREVERSLGNMSREIRSPLSFIVRYSETLGADRLQNLTIAQRKAVGEINVQAVELLELVVRRLLEVVGGGAPLDEAANITALAAETVKTATVAEPEATKAAREPGSVSGAGRALGLPSSPAGRSAA